MQNLSSAEAKGGSSHDAEGHADPPGRGKGRAGSSLRPLPVVPTTAASAPSLGAWSASASSPGAPSSSLDTLYKQRFASSNDHPGSHEPRTPPYRHYLLGDSGGSTGHESCVLWLLLGAKTAPVYRFLNSTAFLLPATTAMVVGVVVGTVAAVAPHGLLADPKASVRFSTLALMIVPLYLQRLLTLDFQILQLLLGEFEVLFVLVNWVLVFPCLGRLLGMGWRLVYFATLTLALGPTLLCDAARGTSKTVFRNILALVCSVVVLCVWVYCVEAEKIPNAFYDKPLLLREDRLAEAVGSAKDVLSTRLIVLLVFALRDLYCSVVHPLNFVLLRLPVRRLELLHEDGEPFGKEQPVVTPL